MNIKKAKVGKPPKYRNIKITPEDHKKMLEMIESGFNRCVIAKDMYNISSQQLFLICKRHNITLPVNPKNLGKTKCKESFKLPSALELKRSEKELDYLYFKNGYYSDFKTVSNKIKRYVKEDKPANGFVAMRGIIRGNPTPDPVWYKHFSDTDTRLSLMEELLF